jgi:signal transduction histidine kinase
VGVFGIAADITARRRNEREIERYEEQLRAKVAELSRAEEQERRMIASALHDEIGQTLALAKIKLETLKQLQESGELEPGIARVRELLDDVIGKTRSLTVELRPPLLYELGLETAIQALCEEFREQYGIDIRFEDDGSDKELDDDQRIFLYRVVRELLVNVVKHSQATAARVCIFREDLWIVLVVKDNGIGFDPATAERRIGVSAGFGLFSIRERVRHAGGRFVIHSHPGDGTRVIVTTRLESAGF